VWGAGGHGKVLVDALLAASQWEVAGIIDEDGNKQNTEVLGINVTLFEGDLRETAKHFRCDAMAIAIGDNYVRCEKFEQLRDAGLSAANVVHPSAHVSPFVKLGEGVVILAGATVNPGTVIEDNVCVNTAASVDHDNHLAHSCHIFPHATLTGTVRIEEFAYVGAGAVVTPNRKVGKYSFVGAGAVVVHDVPKGAVVCGVPAKFIREQTRRPRATAQ
jgi:sugar O-acyltransferase (sialic acid O-acetyltransferase NeuD family)